MSDNYFDNISVAMNLHDKCVICGKDEDFHLMNGNSEEKIFKEWQTSFCKECAMKLKKKLQEGIDF